MIARRVAVPLLWGALLLMAWLPAAPAGAEQGFQRFVPFLVDLPGWTGKKPDGMAMETAGISIVTATRQYERGDARLTATIMTGPAAEGMLKGADTGIKIETSDVRISAETIDGLQVFRSFSVGNKSGLILVGLRSNALFSLASQGVSEDETLGLAKQFNWNAMKDEAK